ncbi:ZapG family protein [Kaarinaea lacus]
MVTWVLFLGIGMVIGIIAGLYFARLDDVTNKQKKALQQKLDASEQQLKAYQSRVTEHFLKTASLVNSMTESYKAVHDHLAMGASQLCDSQVNVAQLEMPAAQLLGVAGEQESARQKPDATVQPEAVEPEASSEQETVAAQQAPQTDESAEEPRQAKPKSQGKAPVSKTASSSAPKPLAEEIDEPQKEAVEAVQPPSTPESLHMDDSEAEESKPITEAEQTSPANASRMVH